ncbi:tripartite tricarboxylate transporter substrate binding protein [Ramlibacter sp.]|uniref:tripartite tricarboxylate transporter substrate binding protein n=1 Tax=Ramlibacter sp. TaxID=1917967 RepID=UPI00262850C2|nr:tripartite tricarboxylate transporter substrate binding protein [Ramlibacter sp.]MDB5956575.1 tctC [Ramlibacter sp.]
MQGISSLLRRILPGLLLATAAAVAPMAAQAAYPEQPIKMIVAYAPGGGTDIIARVIAPYLEKYLGNGAQIVVSNRGGAGGGIGFAELAKAPPDGYTIGFINTPNVLTIPIERKTMFHWQQYDLLGNVIDDPGNFSVHQDSPIKNLAELAAFAKANPGKVSYGTTGIGSDDHLAAMLFERAAGVKLTHVPFKGAAEVHTAVVGKQVYMASMNIGEALQYEKGGSPMRNLGQMATSRTNLAPGVPTFREQGYDIVLASLRGIAAPKGLPPAIRDQLVKAVEKAAADPEFQAQAARYFAPLRYLPPAKYEAELRESEAGFKQLWKDMPWGENVK